MKTTNPFLNITSFELPEYVNEVSEADARIAALRAEISSMIKNNTIDDVLHDKYFEEVAKVLMLVGILSQPAFEVFDDLEEMYKMKYLQAPQLGKKLWLDHYTAIHRPYTILKNRCHTLLEELDEIYIKKFKHTPPNWEI